MIQRSITGEFALDNHPRLRPEYVQLHYIGFIKRIRGMVREECRLRDVPR